MIISGDLTLAQQQSGRRLWIVFNMLNAASFVCIADNVLYLFVLQMGFPQYILPVIASFMYIGFLAMPLGKLMCARVGATATISFFWVLRNAFGLLTASAPLVMYYTSQWAGIAVILVGALGFFASRSAGVVAMNPVLGEISDSHNRGKFNAHQLMGFNGIALFGLGIISVIMMRYPAVSTFQWIIVAGAFMGLGGAWVVRKVVESPTPRISAGVPVWSSFRNIIKTRLGKKLIFANAAALSGIIIVLPVSMAALKSGYGINDSVAIIFALTQFMGGILLSSFSGLVSSQSGPRPVIIISFSTLLLSSVLWVFAPSEFNWLHVFAIFLLNGAGSLGTPMALSHYFLNTVPAEDRMGFSLLVSVIAGPAAGLCSFLIGGGLLRLLPLTGVEGFNLYRIYFLICLLPLMVFLIMLLKLDRIEDWKVGRLLGLFFAPRDFRALLLLNKLDDAGTPGRELRDIERLGHVQSALSAEKILDYLESPKFLVRNKAIMALRDVPMGKKVKKRLIEELQYGTYTTAPMATMILGENRVVEAIPLMRKNLDSENIYLVGRSMCALAQLDDQPSFERIKQIFIESANQFVIIQGAVALTLIGDPGSLKLLLYKTLQDDLDRSVRAEIYSSIAELGDVGNEFYKLFRLYFTREELRDSLCIAFLEELHRKPIPDELLALISEYNTDESKPEKLMELIIKSTSESSLKLLHIISAFLKQAPPDKIRKILLFCLLGICRKTGKL